MIQVGHYNVLRVVEIAADGIYVGDQDEDVFLRQAWVEGKPALGDKVRVFVYTDSEDMAVATTLTPKAVAGEFACLKVVDVSRIGGFVDWGLPKDLFVPFGRQHREMKIGEKVVVAVSVHARTNRPIGSTTLSGHFDDDVSRLREGQEVSLLIYGFNDLGAQVVVDGRHAGLVYHDKIYQRLAVGDELTGFVEKVREDHRLDITLKRPGRGGTVDAKQIILDKLDAMDGHLPLHDKSTPDAILKALGMSKKVFKRAVGVLYRERQIIMVPGGIKRRE
jgi:uncharacterized protein